MYNVREFVRVCVFFLMLYKFIEFFFFFVSYPLYPCFYLICLPYLGLYS